MQGQARRRMVVACAAVFVLAGGASGPVLAAPLAGAGVGWTVRQGTQPAGRSADGVWSPASQRTGRDARPDRRIFSGPHVLVHLDKTSLDGVLQRAPMERRGGRPALETVMSLPMPDGSFQAFRIRESPILVPELAALVPGIRTYSGQGIDDPAATTRFDWTPTGFHGMVHAPDGTTFIDPFTAGDRETYVSYAKRDYSRDDTSFLCLVGGAARASSSTLPAMDVANGGTLRTYRLALAATVEYMAAAGGTKLLALSRMATTMNRVNGIYERELAVRMTVMTGPVGCSASPTPDDACMALIAPDPTVYPYTNGDANLMLTQNQANIDSIVGPANYDIGHVFATAGGGLAEIGVTCDGLYKAEGVTGAANPTGDAFDIDYVAHEMGHQFGGHHTFNGTSGNCGVPNRSPDHAYEPGSGSTVMSYAGICSPEDLQSHSQDNFHVESLNEITSFIANASTGGSCAVPSATGNTPPTVNAGSSYTIPELTPFALTATASDPNPDALTYSWEQYNLGAASFDVVSASTDDGTRPILRALGPSSSPTRVFPSPGFILNDANTPPQTYSGTSIVGAICGTGPCLTGEVLPSTARTMQFFVTVRDNYVGGGGVATSSATVTVNPSVGPFLVTAPNARVTWTEGSAQLVTWAVNGTDALAATVNILLSTDGGLTFPTVLAAATPNDGSQTVAMPNTVTAAARIKIEAVGNVFFDVSDADFAITSGTVSASPTSLRFGAAKAGPSGALLAVTGAQTVSVEFTGATSAWTAATTEPWIQLTNASGTGAGQFTVGIVNPGNVIGGSTTLAGTVTVTAATSSGSPLSIPVTLTVDQTGGTALRPPFGQVDSPPQNASGVVGGIPMTGWALDDVEVSGVKIYRNCLAFEPQNCQVVGGSSVVFVGDAAFIAEARPDVEAAFPTLPRSNRAGWGYLLLTNMLPHVTNQLAYGGQGPLTLYAFATDAEGRVAALGRTTADQTPTAITMTNDTIAKPFGAIDTPGQGATVSGATVNFGWALTPDDGSGILLPVDGSTMRVFIDGVPVKTVAYNQCRGTVGNPVPSGQFCDDDVASIFGNTTPQPIFTPRLANPTKFRNLDAGRGAIGAFAFDTTAFGNGLHTIAWGVTDSAGRAEGIGSRYFSVLNAGTAARGAASSVTVSQSAADSPIAPAAAGSSARPATGLDGAGVPVSGRTGFDLSAAYDSVPTPADGVRRVQIPELGRLDLQLGPVDNGYLVANGARRDLPPGSALDKATGQFTWAPGVGYVGTYRLTFVREQDQVQFDVTIRPASPAAPGESEIRMSVDSPQNGQVVSGPVTVAGWALDPQAAFGAGIGYVHVWAQRRDLPGAQPAFLGAATLAGTRPDVAAAYGEQFGAAGFGLTTAALSPGQYDVTVFAWSRRTGRWEDARTLTLAVR